MKQGLADPNSALWGGAKDLAELAPVVRGHLLHHDKIGIGVGKKLGDVVDPVVVMPDIEGDDSEKTRGSFRCLLRAAFEREREMGAVDDGKKDASTVSRPLRARAARIATMSVPTRRKGSPLLTMSSAGNHRASKPIRVRIAPMTSPALASAFKANGMFYFPLCSGLGKVRGGA
jgi:hypothetical protein